MLRVAVEAASRKDCDEHLDAEDHPKEAREDAEDQGEAADHLEPANEKPDRTREAHVHEHVFHKTDVVDLHPAMHEKDETRREADQEKSERTVASKATQSIDC